MLGVYGIHVPRGRDIYQRPLRVAIALDTSGRISNTMLRTFLSEVINIIDDFPDVVVLLIQTDGKVYKYDEFRSSESLPEVEVSGKGGRNTTPTFDFIEEDRWKPDLLVYFTDLDVDFPNHIPSYYVVWITTGDKTDVPFGEVLTYDSSI